MEDAKSIQEPRRITTLGPLTSRASQSALCGLARPLKACYLLASVSAIVNVLVTMRKRRLQVHATPHPKLVLPHLARDFAPRISFQTGACRPDLQAVGCDAIAPLVKRPMLPPQSRLVRQALKPHRPPSSVGFLLVWWCRQNDIRIP
jgi:hypothetical protein